MASVYIVPLIWSARAAQQKMWLHLLTSLLGARSALFYTMLMLLGGSVTSGGAGVLRAGGFDWVLWTPLGTFFMCPLAVAVESGRYFLTAVGVRPGHDLKWPFFMASIHVDCGGLKAHWCKNWISFCFELSW